MKGWKTITFGALTALAAALATPEMAAFVAENLPWVGGGLGTAVVILRWLTTTPIFKAE